MLTRTPYSGGVAGSATSFTWDGWDCIKESSSTSTTRYYCPQGELQSFERDGVTYQSHNDGLGSCRLVTNASGAVVANFSYDAWGNLLSTSTDSVPGGMPYRFVGAYGIRWEPAIGLYYIRQRFYDPSLQRFISRDSRPATNRYQYAINRPMNYLDLDGAKVTLSQDLVSYCEAHGHHNFQDKWDKAKALALARAIKNTNNPDCGCWPSDIDYLSALQDDGNWNVNFQLATQAQMNDWADSADVWVTESPNDVYGTELACPDDREIDIDSLANQIIHELTHAGIRKRFAGSKNIYAPENVGPDNPLERHHPYRYFRDGIDKCR